MITYFLLSTLVAFVCSTGCTTSTDCSNRGICSDSRCQCNPGYYGDTCEHVFDEHVACPDIEVPYDQSHEIDGEVLYDQNEATVTVIAEFQHFQATELDIDITGSTGADRCTFNSLDYNSNEWMDFTRVVNGVCMRKAISVIPLQVLLEQCTGVEDYPYPYEFTFDGYRAEFNFKTTGSRESINGHYQIVEDSLKFERIIVVQVRTIADCGVQIDDPIDEFFSGVTDTNTDLETIVHVTEFQILMPTGAFFEQYTFTPISITSGLFGNAGLVVFKNRQLIGNVYVHTFELILTLPCCAGFPQTSFSIDLEVFHEGVSRGVMAVLVTTLMDDQCDDTYISLLEKEVMCPNPSLFEIGSVVTTSVKLTSTLMDIGNIVLEELSFLLPVSMENIGDLVLARESTSFGVLMGVTADADCVKVVSGREAIITYSFTLSVDWPDYYLIIDDNAMNQVIASATLLVIHEGFEDITERKVVTMEMRRDAEDPGRFSCGFGVLGDEESTRFVLSGTFKTVLIVVVSSISTVCLFGFVLLVCIGVGICSYCLRRKNDGKEKPVVKKEMDDVEPKEKKEEENITV